MIAGDNATSDQIAMIREKLGLTLPIVVYDNSGYGEIRDSMDRAHVPHAGVDTSVMLNTV